MKNIIQFKIYQEDGVYIGECVDLPIVTQGKTIDETVKNIREALDLYLEGEDLSVFDITQNPSALVNLELPQVCLS